MNNICDVIKDIRSGLKPESQDHSNATVAEKIHKSEGLIDWATTSYEIKNKFLAFKKWPKVFFKFNIFKYICSHHLVACCYIGYFAKVN